MLGNIMQQLYNLADTWIVGRYIGDNSLAAVGSSYTLITFLTSVIIGLLPDKGLCYIGIGYFFISCVNVADTENKQGCCIR